MGTRKDLSKERRLLRYLEITGGFLALLLTTLLLQKLTKDGTITFVEAAIIELLVFAVTVLVVVVIELITLNAAIDRYGSEAENARHVVLSKIASLKLNIESCGALLRSAADTKVAQIADSMNKSVILDPYRLELLSEVSQLSRGVHEMTNKQPHAIWDSHKNKIQLMESGAEILATCVIPRSASEVEALFSASAYKGYCTASYDAVATGRMSLMKLFILTKDIAAHSLVIAHFTEFVERQKAIEGDEVNTTMQGKFLFEEDIELHRSGGKDGSELDFVVWGEAGVSVSYMEGWARVSGVRISEDKDDVTEKTGVFRRWWDLDASVPIDRIGSLSRGD